VLKILVVFWVVTPYSDVVGYHCFRKPCCLCLHPQDSTNKAVVHVGILPHHYMS